MALSGSSRFKGTRAHACPRVLAPTCTAALHGLWVCACVCWCVLAIPIGTDCLVAIVAYVVTYCVVVAAAVAAAVSHANASVQLLC
jgi:hypothetical protein